MGVVSGSHSPGQCAERHREVALGPMPIRWRDMSRDLYSPSSVLLQF